MDILVFFGVAIRFILDPNVTAKSFISLGGNAGAGISLVPLYCLAISGAILLVDAIVVHRICDSISARIEMTK
jgi:hypothetical protein